MEKSGLRFSGARGVGGLREVGEETARRGISEVVGTGRNRKNFTTLCNILQ